MMNARVPNPNGIAIIAKVNNPPLLAKDVFPNVDPSSAYFTEVYDCEIGVFDPSGTFVTFLADSRRLEIYDPED